MITVGGNFALTSVDHKTVNGFLKSRIQSTWNLEPRTSALVVSSLQAQSVVRDWASIKHDPKRWSLLVDVIDSDPALDDKTCGFASDRSRNSPGSKVFFGKIDNFYIGLTVHIL